MAKFNIDAPLSKGKQVTWQASLEDGESLKDVVSQMKTAATRKFGLAAPLRRWAITRDSSGTIIVTMHM
ncbi:hypothetical protein [Metapseudomonas otitidis]|uniref:hypothetical protein n=1 Tax=Metapseudomonas otitidis TaxID=319939 RepID=UPI003672D169